MPFGWVAQAGLEQRCCPNFCNLMSLGQESASQRSLHNEPIFRLLLKVAVKGTQQCEFLNFCGALAPTHCRQVSFRCLVWPFCLAGQPRSVTPRGLPHGAAKNGQTFVGFRKEPAMEDHANLFLFVVGDSGHTTAWHAGSFMP